MRLQWRVLVLVLFGVLLLLLLLLWALPECPPSSGARDAPPDCALDGGPGLHVVLQVPALSSPPARRGEYAAALLVTLQHPQVICVHALCESPVHEARLQIEVPPAVQHKMHTHNIAKRMAYADAVRYANDRLAGRLVLLCNADVTVGGNNWLQLNASIMANHMFGLTRHELPGCAAQCDCRHGWLGCHDCYVFVPPLGGGDALLERISFRMGGLWGAENRFMWEVQQANPQLIISNPCLTFKTLHLHCTGGGRFRPTQDERRVNGEGRSLQPWPSKWAQ